MRPQNQSRQEQQKQMQDQQQDYDSFLYRFQQQIISAWKPVPHASTNVILYLILSAICLGLGIALIITASSSQQVFIRYDNACALGTTGCTVSFQLTEILPAPVYFYYGMKGYYQNHRRYIKFFSFAQQEGSIIDLAAANIEGACSSLSTNTQCNFIGTAADGVTPLVGDNVAFPCGTRSKSYYELRPQINSFVLRNSSSNIVALNRSAVAWPGDIGSWVNANLSIQAFDVTQQDWLVWFRPAARNSFYKLFASINSDMAPGNYTITFNNVFASDFGQKHFHIGKSNYVGNRDLFLGIAFTAVGGICVILFIVFIARWINEKREKASKQL